MIYGITGNTNKEKLWEPAFHLIQHLDQRGLPYLLDAAVKTGLIERGFILKAETICTPAEKLADKATVILSFGGDGTLLNTAAQVGNREVPILGVNIGQLGFLADIDESRLEEAVARLEAREFTIEPRMVLKALDSATKETYFALNEFSFEKSATSGMIRVAVTVNQRFLNTYEADGLIFSTPTGSTAYSLSGGGPIVTPTSEVAIITPVAPHTLTMRPLIVPANSVIEARITTAGRPFVFSFDGRSQILDHENTSFVIEKADHVINLIKLPEQDYFDTLRKKLMWGAGRAS